MAIVIPKVLQETYPKNKDDIRALICATYPAFVYRNVPAVPAGQIPVFALHGVNFDQFERRIQHISQNGYKTLTSDELYDVLVGNRPPEENSIVLTFDDGCRSLWSIVYPLLKKHGLKATAFVVSSAVPNSSSTGCNLEDIWSGKASLADLRNEENEEPLCNWDELAAMQTNGTIDNQSHTIFHSSVFTTNNIIGFVSPSMNLGFLASDYNPMLIQSGKSI